MSNVCSRKYDLTVRSLFGQLFGAVQFLPGIFHVQANIDLHWQNCKQICNSGHVTDSLVIYHCECSKLLGTVKSFFGRLGYLTHAIMCTQRTTNQQSSSSSTLRQNISYLANNIYLANIAFLYSSPEIQSASKATASQNQRLLGVQHHLLLHQPTTKNEISTNSRAGQFASSFK